MDHGYPYPLAVISVEQGEAHSRPHSLRVSHPLEQLDHLTASGTKGFQIQTSSSKMVHLVKQMLGAFRSKDPNKKNEVDLVFREDAVFRFANVLDAATDGIKVQVKPTDVTLINRGEISITERIIIVEKSKVPDCVERLAKVHAKWAASGERPPKTTDKKFVLTNKKHLTIHTECYVLIDDTEAFFKSGEVLKLVNGLEREPAVTIKEKGRIRKSVEMVAKWNEGMLKALNITPIVETLPDDNLTSFEKKIIEKHNLKWNDLYCLQKALVGMTE